MMAGSSSDEISLSPEQCRAARGFLGWRMEDLARRTGITRNTIQNFETGKHAAQPATLAALRTCFEAAGLRFTADAVEESVTRRRSD